MCARFVSRAASAALLLLMATYGPAMSMPNYARQPGVSCLSCHSGLSSQSQVDAFSQKEGSKVLFVSPISSGKLKAGVSMHKGKADLSWASPPVSQAFAESISPQGRSGKGSVLSGLSGFISGESFYAALGFLGQKTGILPSADKSSSSLWYRVGYTPQLGSVNLDMGVFGDTKVVDRLAASRLSNLPELGKETGTIGVDANAVSDLGDMTLSLKAVYLNSGEPLVNTGTQPLEGSNGFGASARLGISRNFGLSAAYHTYTGKTWDSGFRQDAAVIGADVNIADKVTLKSQYTSYGLDKNALTGTDGGAFSILLITGF